MPLKIDTIIKMLIALFGEYLINPRSAAKYVKWLIRGRMYLNLLVPVEIYPDDWEGTNINPKQTKKYAIPVTAVKAEAEERGFKMPKVNQTKKSQSVF